MITSRGESALKARTKVEILTSWRADPGTGPESHRGYQQRHRFAELVDGFLAQYMPGSTMSVVSGRTQRGDSREVSMQPPWA
ncbi:MAG: hypothetical protein ACI9LD_000153 [Polaromonas sp.]